MGALTKERLRTLVTPYTPARPAIAPVPFRMYATPPPLGWTYNQLQSGSTLGPNSPSSFYGWRQIVRAPPEYAPTGRMVYKTLAELGFDLSAGGSYAYPLSWSPVYQTVDGVSVLVGFMVPETTGVELPPRYYGPIAHMDFWGFPGVPTAANGYPLSAGPVTGVLDVPTVDGYQRLQWQFVKDRNGVWLPAQRYPLPPYCVLHGPCQILMMSGFPGRAGLPARPPVYADDFNVGWNAGAMSAEAFDGDVRTRFSCHIKAAGAVGFQSADGGDIADLSRLTHAFYFDTGPQGLRAQPMERGRLVGAAVPYQADTTHFEIRREGGGVRYLVDGVVIHVSTVPSGGPVAVGCSLYRADDRIN